MADFKVGDRVRVRKGLRKRHYGNHEIPHGIGVVLKLDTTDGTVEVRYDRKDCWFLSDELELVATAEPAEPAQPDPRDAEIVALKAEIERLKSRIAGLMLECVRKGPVLTLDDDRLYFRQLVIELIRANRSNVMWEANGIFDEVLHREAKGGAA